MPSWWMPDSWAKALAPTMALLRCTTMPVMRLTIRDDFMISRVLTPVHTFSASERVFIAMTASSSEQLPARSPMPLIVHSICRAPACTAASELATANPRSLWQCTEKITPGTFTRATRYSISAPYS